MIRSAALPSNRLVATLLAVTLCRLLWPDAALAQGPHADSPKPVPVAERTDIFRAALEILNFEPVTDFKELNPKDCILIVLGDTRCLTEVPGGLKQFLLDGGAAFIASDKPMQPAAEVALMEASGVEIHRWLPDDPFDKNLCYRELNYCPYVISKDRRFMRHPKTGQEIKVATNIPSTLWIYSTLNNRRQLKDGDIFAFLPKSARDSHPFGLAADVGKGRVLVLADHSIFINEMMKPSDNGNLEFTQNCLNYLRGEPPQRKRVLFVDDGTICPSFKTEFPKSTTPKPKKSELAARILANAIEEAKDRVQNTNGALNTWQGDLNSIDQEDGFERGVHDFLSNYFDKRFLVRLLLVLGTLGLLIYGCYRLGIVSRVRREAAVPSSARAARYQGPRAEFLQMRHEGLLDAGNVQEAGRQLARDAFEAGGVAAPVPYREPAVQLQGVGWWRRASVRQQVLHLWRMAFRPKPTPIAPHALQALANELEQLKSDLKRGTIQLS